MLVQWRYKIVKRFAREGQELYCSEKYPELKRMKPRPYGLFLYRPSQRRYDYVDYTGHVKGVPSEAGDITAYLEMLGYIKFIEKKICDEEFFE